MSLVSRVQILSITCLMFAAVALTGMFSCATVAESVHVQGPAGLEGWTELQTFANGDRASRTLVIARHGKLIRRISGDPFVWQWKFWENGQQLIFEAGPVHFGMTCVWIDLCTGRALESVDCYSNLPPAGNLDWVDA